MITNCVSSEVNVPSFFEFISTTIITSTSKYYITIIHSKIDPEPSRYFLSEELKRFPQTYHKPLLFMTFQCIRTSCVSGWQLNIAITFTIKLDDDTRHNSVQECFEVISTIFSGVKSRLVMFYCFR